MIASGSGRSRRRAGCPGAEAHGTPPQEPDQAHAFAELPAATSAECLLKSFVARSALVAGPIAVAGDLAEQVASHPALVGERGGHPLWRTNITICLVEAERYEVADRMLSRAIRHAERVGSPQWLARALWLRGLARHRSGDLRAAEADGRAAVDIHGLTADDIKTPGLVVVVDSARRSRTRRKRARICSANGGWTPNSRRRCSQCCPCWRAAGAVPPWGTMRGLVPTWRKRYAVSKSVVAFFCGGE